MSGTAAPSPRDDRTIPEKGTLSAARAGNGMSAQDKIVTFYFGGVVFLLVGLVVMFANWPGVEPGYYDDIETGSEALAFFGAAVAGIGQILLTVAIIASGVRLGMRRD